MSRKWHTSSSSFFSLRENFLLICGFLLRPKRVLLYRIKYSPAIFTTQYCSKTRFFNNILILSCPETLYFFGNIKNNIIWYCEYCARVFYSIESNVFGTQEKAAYQKKIFSQRKKKKKYITLGRKNDYFGHRSLQKQHFPRTWFQGFCSNFWQNRKYHSQTMYPGW